MIDQKIRDKYEPTIGIECHVQLNTKTKLFAAVDNDSRGKDPNTTTSPICFGMPGVLPYLNEEAVRLAIRTGLALNADVSKFSKFDRKHYFYPDLPKGYQITQFDQPIIGEGYIETSVKGKSLKVRIERAHLEEDAGKLTHPSGADYSQVDLNRAGTPLLEIVSFPDMHSAAEAKAYVRELYNIVKFAQVSDVDLYHGNMRFDVNVSVAPKDSDKLGTRAEVKNLNSFKSVERATLYEIERQIKLLEKKDHIIQETRGWDEAKQKTLSQRGKEDAHDYRYFPEPDLPPIVITNERIQAEKDNLPPLPAELRSDLSAAGLNSEMTEVMIDNPDLMQITLSVMEKADKKDILKVANWLVVDVMGYINNHPNFNVSKHHLVSEELINLAEMTRNSDLSSNGATKVLLRMLVNGGHARELAQELNVLQISDSSEVEKVVDQVINDNPKPVKDVVNGEMKAIGFLVGQVMQRSKGQANPTVAKEILEKKIKEIEIS